MAKITPLGSIASAISRMSTALYQAPPDNIDGIDPAMWPTPLQPIPPVAPKGAEPLGWPYQYGANLTYTPRADAEYSAADLRALSKYPLARICIENVKDQLTRIPWTIKLRPQPGELEQDRQKRGLGDATLKKLTTFFERPNPEQDYSDFVRRLVDDMLVIDAASIYKQRARGNNKTGNGRDIAYCRYVPGDNITRYIDANGFTPEPPSPAYAQIWEGLPRTNLTTIQLSYRPRNIVPRNTYASYLYGYSPTEQMVEEILVGAFRLKYVLNFYEKGSVPGIVHVVPPNADKGKLLETMQWMNSELAGQLEKRRQWRMIQGFNEKGADQILVLKDPVLADVFDDLHIRKICFGYGTSPQRLQRMMNRASAQTSQESAEEEGMEPWKQWLKSVLDDLIQQPTGFSQPLYEIELQSGQETDLKKLADTDKVLISCARSTINERRKAAGEDPDPNPMADKLGIITGTGFIPLEQPAQQAEAMAAALGGAPGEGAPAGGGSPAPASKAFRAHSNGKVDKQLASAIAVLDEEMDLWEGRTIFKKQASDSKGWIGVDLDGTLVQYTGDPSSIGEPIEPMIDRVKQWLEDGEQVKIFTARIANDPQGLQRQKIMDFCREYFGVVLPITNVKDQDMIELWDDRAVRVDHNLGQPLSPHSKAWTEAAWEASAEARAVQHEINERQLRAQATHKPATADKQRIADLSEQKLSRALKISRTTDNAPFDLKDDKRGIEIKTLVDNSNNKITMHKDSLKRKIDYAEANNLRTYTVVIDRRSATTGYYFAKGLGSFRIGSMQRTTLTELKGLIK